ncbi:hypothetical protein MAM1_0383d10205 [Mucor ambiguus]|uniref:Uncharacterized protein n=1 Tax=Mucor ambiguus TaxID=91626 RepID=A0A0C9LY44_9FUNG|nr:hypothetical protein MAM1_0383d10205 [Mucor ambiguus]
MKELEKGIVSGAETAAGLSDARILRSHETQFDASNAINRSLENLMTNGKLKAIKGPSVCTNPHCVLVKKRMFHKIRDAVSSLAIGLTGLHAAIFGSPLGPFDPKGISHSNTDNMYDATISFCARSQEWLELDELKT